jgi:sugar/nucleoside kinase (ribokinase family)
MASISICHIAMTNFKLAATNHYPPSITLVLSISLQEFSGRVEGMKVDAVDTTGAGDAFVAGILSQLATDLSLIQVSRSICRL